jgi:Fe-Mn family superoxide dismutase
MFVLPDLPYAYDALSPYISERTLKFHHDKHHAAYVKTTGELVQKAGLKPESLEALIRQASQKGDKKLFNNAAQAWNHGFFWVAMTPRHEAPTGDLHDAIRAAYGDLAALKQRFVEEGAGHFGSGWVWLVADKIGSLDVRSTHDADDTLTKEGVTPLLVCDLWEHAYYLDYQNDRKGFLDAWFDHLPNWSLAASQFAAAKGAGAPWRYPASESAPPLRKAG